MNSSNYSITIILLGFAALFSSIKMFEKRDLPILRFVVGLCIVLALVSQAILTQNQYFLIFGFIALIVFTIDYAKHSKYMKN
jgi:Ca2+/Na+ antiporter